MSTAKRPPPANPAAPPSPPTPPPPVRPGQELLEALIRRVERSDSILERQLATAEAGFVAAVLETTDTASSAIRFASMLLMEQRSLRLHQAEKRLDRTSHALETIANGMISLMPSVFGLFARKPRATESEKVEKRATPPVASKKPKATKRASGKRRAA